jgi:hypothetical protein
VPTVPTVPAGCARRDRPTAAPALRRLLGQCPDV